MGAYIHLYIACTYICRENTAEMKQTEQEKSCALTKVMVIKIIPSEGTYVTPPFKGETKTVNTKDSD